MPPQKRLRVSIVGAGAVGSTLARVLSDKGFPIVSIISRTGKSAVELAKAVKCKKASTQISDIAPDSELIIVATSDVAVPDVARELARVRKLKFRNLFVVHTSGVHSSNALNILREKGTTVASVHPIQTFPASQRPAELKARLKGIFYGIDGNASSLPRAERLVDELGGKSVVIPEAMKPLYHVACVFASSYMMIVLNVLSELAGHLQLKASWTEVFGPLMTAAMENSIRYSAAEALTGPILRSDMATIDLHLSTLAKQAPQFLPLYTVCGIEAARLAKGHGRVSQADFDQIVERFRTFVKKIPSRKTKR